jgi:hypothetical protein
LDYLSSEDFRLLLNGIGNINVTTFNDESGKLIEKKKKEKYLNKIFLF